MFLFKEYRQHTPKIKQLVGKVGGTLAVLNSTAPNYVLVDQLAFQSPHSAKLPSPGN
jgi:hypothetical protein